MYPVNGPVTYSMEMQLKIVPKTQEQISMVAFMGQNGVHDQGSDHLAISYIKGYIMLTWNLGSGSYFFYQVYFIEYFIII